MNQRFPTMRRRRFWRLQLLISTQSSAQFLRSRRVQRFMKRWFSRRVSRGADPAVVRRQFAEFRDFLIDFDNSDDTHRTFHATPCTCPERAEHDGGLT